MREHRTGVAPQRVASRTIGGAPATRRRSRRAQPARVRVRVAAAAAAGAILATLVGPISTASAELPIAGNPAPIEGQGQAWHEIEADIDQLAQAMIVEDALAGVSISASKDGRLVVSAPLAPHCPTPTPTPIPAPPRTPLRDRTAPAKQLGLVEIHPVGEGAAHGDHVLAWLVQVGALAGVRQAEGLEPLTPCLQNSSRL